jgi:hypothetical protein
MIEFKLTDVQMAFRPLGRQTARAPADNTDEDRRNVQGSRGCKIPSLAINFMAVNKKADCSLTMSARGLLHRDCGKDLRGWREGTA